ncbi:hypothetical protein AQJ84_39215 [Streptomyces resistomycificus]|uniref:Uncharacterized protein n=1 Tax=Streptomyces resistomycificus TaxID=67356 RepID=A0A0L8L3S5_9ACTN|nr:hypothetical protein ADK37_25655 [Streptomyces resistomycificus]KUN90672.1 hypothetical protein AQJ84_39215 [Streptomyces resistomycificus]
MSALDNQRILNVLQDRPDREPGRLLAGKRRGALLRLSAASSAAAARAAVSRRPSTRSRAAVSRASSNPSIDATAHPSTI